MSKQLSSRRHRLLLLCLGGLLGLIHFVWYLGVWPGPMGQDGYSLIANINEGTPKYTGKESAWLLYALATYGITSRLEAIVIPLIFLHVAIYTRIIGWIYIQGYKKTAFFLLVFIACAPHVLNYETSIYPDSIFSLAFIGVLFELWICLKSRRLTPYSLVVLTVLLPFAAFFRGNGILVYAPLLYLACLLKGKGRRYLVIMSIAWIFIIQIGGKFFDLGRGHGALQPLILFETVNFMQYKPMNLWENRHMVTDETKRIVYKYISQEDIDGLFDRDYWDTLWHQNQDRVRFRQMTRKDRSKLTKEFFTYNLWRNLPAFISSRVNIFLAAAFAQGGMVGPGDAKNGLAKVETKSINNALNLNVLPQLTQKAFDFSYSFRFLLWTPFLGIFLIIRCFLVSIRRRDVVVLLIAGTLLAEMVGIFIFSIAAEYRYMLMIFFSPLLFLPIFYSQGASNLKCNTCSPKSSADANCLKGIPPTPV